MAELDVLVNFTSKHQPQIQCRRCGTANLMFYWTTDGTYAGARCKHCGWQWWKKGQKDG